MSKDEMWLRYFELAMRNHLEGVRSAADGVPDPDFPEKAAAFAAAGVAAWEARGAPQPQGSLKTGVPAGRTR